MLYRELHERTPNVEFRERYEQLTGERLPDPPLLPPVADSVAGGEIDIDVLVARAETLSAQFE